MHTSAAWVKPPHQIGGLDHLSVQAPCINIYGRLLPGITNVTDRARYYSFYPWLIWALEHAGYDTFNEEFIVLFRRADCLFSLIAERHAAVAGGEYAGHAGAIVGTATLYTVARDLAGGGSIRLSDYSRRDGAQKRYFKNKMGGLGQYYLGVLRELLVLGGDSSAGIKYSRPFGESIAEAVDKGVIRSLFINIVVADEVTASQLDELAAFCPCSLQTNQVEIDLIREMMFVQGRFEQDDHLPRRRTLQLILQLCDRFSKIGQPLTEDGFRGCAYAQSLPDGSSLSLPSRLTQNWSRWNAYARQELLSIAIQGIFFALLDAYEESGLRFQATEDLVGWYCRLPEASAALGALPVGATLEALTASMSESLPLVSEWGDSGHECQMAEEVIRLSAGRRGADQREAICHKSLSILIALLVRRDPNKPAFGDLVFPARYFDQYPINLKTLGYFADGSWAKLDRQEWLRWLLAHWGMNTHMRVALRKLRGQSKSTFRIRPSDDGYEVIGVPQAVHTTPRFKQAYRMLKDIGALDPVEKGAWSPSDFGRKMMELGTGG